MSPKPLALLATLLLVNLPLAARAEDEQPPAEDEYPSVAEATKDMKGSKDHPAVKRYPGSIIYDQYAEKEFDDFQFELGNHKAEKAAGKFYQANYKFPKNQSCTQVIRNFENAFKAAGMKTASGGQDSLSPTPALLFNDVDRYVTGVGKGKDGAKTYMMQTCQDYAGNFVTGVLTVVEVEQMSQKVEMNADYLDEQIGRTGRIALYGINFATGRAVITPDSTKLLDAIATLLKKKEWRLRIEGHTDTVGNEKANLELSKKRALAVKEYLVTEQKIEESRLTTDGFGGSKPIDENTTEAGRAKNRRVELVKL